ncbi:MAG: methyltransferase domain-containing protein [Anaerolineales bacterium]|nr:MAG: methyltransferase domain-containing protein [Anaerolineales bacterium]
MPHADAQIWDERYTNEERRRNHHPPRPLVISHLDLLPPNRLVLDAACGTTATGLHLAEHGWQVIALDVSIAALRLARSRVRNEALPISFALMDLTDPWLPEDHFDIVLNFYYLSRPLLSTYRKSLKPGGFLFFETFLRDENFSHETDGSPHHYLEPFELKHAFNGWDIIHYAETKRDDRPGRARRIAQMVARKPL